MSTILESVNTLSEKLGVTEREQTIKDQLDLCVERLGGEGNSKDIADSAEKFAEKEDGTATFMTKTITENNTYNAADDGVSGYSSVTVNVPSGGVDVGFSSIPFITGSSTLTIYSCSFNMNENGEFDVVLDTGASDKKYGSSAILSQPATKVNIETHIPSGSITFTPAETFDGFYDSSGTNKYELSGDEIVPGDNKVYILDINGMMKTYSVTKTDFSINE